MARCFGMLPLTQVMRKRKQAVFGLGRSWACIWGGRAAMHCKMCSLPTAWQRAKKQPHLTASLLITITWQENAICRTKTEMETRLLRREVHSIMKGAVIVSFVVFFHSFLIRHIEISRVDTRWFQISGIRCNSSAHKHAHWPLRVCDLECVSKTQGFDQGSYMQADQAPDYFIETMSVSQRAQLSGGHIFHIWN